MKEVTLPKLSAAQSESWTGLLDLAEQVPDGWALIGGQMVHLHCWERKATPNRPTDDLDVVLDIHTAPTMLKKFTQVLVDLGFSSEGKSWEGHEHRWVRGGAVIDLLIASGLGKRASSKKVSSLKRKIGLINSVSGSF